MRRNTNTIVRLVSVPYQGGMIATNRLFGRRPAQLGPVERVPLVVRYTHPGYLGKRVAFFPS